MHAIRVSFRVENVSKHEREELKLTMVHGDSTVDSPSVVR